MFCFETTIHEEKVRFSLLKENLAVLSYTATGLPAGQGVIFLHGFLGSKQDWQQIVSLLSDSFYCITIDLPGHGQSVRLPDAMYSFAGVSAGIMEIVEEVDKRGLWIAGYSMGGRIGLYTYLANKKYFHGALIESAHPGLRYDEERQERRGIDERRASRLETSSLSAFLKEWYTMPLFESLDRYPGMREQLFEQRLKNNPRELARALRGLGTGVQPSLWDPMAESDIRVFYLSGGEDARYQDIGEQIEMRVSTARVAVVPDTGHNVHLERPKEFTRILKQLLLT